MLTELSKEQKDWIKEKIDTMSRREKIGQVLVMLQGENKLEEYLEEYPIGGMLVGVKSPEDALKMKESIDKYNRTHDIPFIQAADLENGAGIIKGRGTPFPAIMALGAVSSAELAREMGRATAREARPYGISWTYAPVVDLDFDFNNSMTYGRAFGRSPEHVARLARAFIGGCQEDGLLACAAKHFPGDGFDARDPHVVTPVITLSREEWTATYGHVYREVIDEGVMSIMTGHVALPAFDEGEGGYLGPPPATMSTALQVDLLRGKLGFDGLIVSDAVDMIGYASRLPKPQRAVRTLAAGADIALRVEERDFVWIEEAVERGDLSEERLNDAVRRVLEFKMRIGAFGEQTFPFVDEEGKRRHEEVARTISEGAIHIVRNEGGLLPLKLSSGARLLSMDLQFPARDGSKAAGLSEIPAALRERGYEVDHMVSPLHGDFDIYPIIDNYEAVFVNFNVPPRYGCQKMNSAVLDALWNGWWMDHGKVVFTSFFNPFAIWEVPWVPNYVNAFHNNRCSQRAAVKVWLGEMPARGKSPVGLEGFFDVEV